MGWKIVNKLFRYRTFLTWSRCLKALYNSLSFRCISSGCLFPQDTTMVCDEAGIEPPTIWSFDNRPGLQPQRSPVAPKPRVPQRRRIVALLVVAGLGSVHRGSCSSVTWRQQQQSSEQKPAEDNPDGHVWVCNIVTMHTFYVSYPAAPAVGHPHRHWCKRRDTHTYTHLQTLSHTHTH